jgi:DNA-binding response OmpR family regulator
MSNKSQKVLVVDDDAEIREVVAFALRHHGFDVDTAADRDTALELIRGSGMPDVILLDFQMSGLTAKKFVAELEAFTAPQPRVVLMTAADQADIRARKLGVAEVLRKPFESTALFEQIRKTRE